MNILSLILKSPSLIIIAITAIISIIGFSNKKFFYQLALQPYNVFHYKKIYQMLTCGFLHANWMHLIINMFVFYSFSEITIYNFYANWGIIGIFLFIFLYLSAIVVSSIYSTIKHRNNPRYIAIGASGATSAITYTFILFYPWEKLYFFFAIPIPAIIFGAIYLVYCFIMDKVGKDNIGHNAHFWGAVYGFIFPILLKPSLFLNFISKLTNF